MMKSLNFLRDREGNNNHKLFTTIAKIEESRWRERERENKQKQVINKSESGIVVEEALIEQVIHGNVGCVECVAAGNVRRKRGRGWSLSASSTSH
jgi:N-acetylglutamate synthase-like GNAT family acetyltransferase